MRYRRFLWRRSDGAGILLRAASTASVHHRLDDHVHADLFLIWPRLLARTELRENGEEALFVGGIRNRLEVGPDFLRRLFGPILPDQQRGQVHVCPDGSDWIEAESLLQGGATVLTTIQRDIAFAACSRSGMASAYLPA